MPEDKKPVMKFKAGNVTASIWRHKGELGTFFNVSLEKNYKDKEGNWKSSGNLNLPEIQKAVLVLNQCYAWIMQSSKLSEGNSEE